MNSAGFIDYVMDILAPYGNIKGKQMFSGYSLYNHGIIFAIIVDDELYFKTDPALAKEYAQAGSRPFTYSRDDKTISMCYSTVPAEALEDAEQLEEWFNKTWLVAQKASIKKSKKADLRP